MFQLRLPIRAALDAFGRVWTCAIFDPTCSDLISPDPAQRGARPPWGVETGTSRWWTKVTTKKRPAAGTPGAGLNPWGELHRQLPSELLSDAAPMYSR